MRLRRSRGILEVQDEQRDRKGEDAVAESFDTCRLLLFGLLGARNHPKGLLQFDKYCFAQVSYTQANCGPGDAKCLSDLVALADEQRQ